MINGCVINNWTASLVFINCIESQFIEKPILWSNLSYHLKKESATGGVLEKRCSLKFRKFHRKTLVLGSLFNKVAGLKACNVSKKRDSTTGVSCENYVIFKNTYNALQLIVIYLCDSMACRTYGFSKVELNLISLSLSQETLNVDSTVVFVERTSRR